MVFSPRQQFFFAVGFLLAAVRARLHDLARPAWRPVDWLLRASSRTNGYIAPAVGAQAIYIVGDGSLPALAPRCGSRAALLAHLCM
ncbi:hypothetical protein [Streptomyces sp. NPDC060035]|uniref:hypothetical protein n=1 Tax=Streptomyces sp. NPDC060035 TaxID=3347044 RepID=UPI0036B2A983